MHVMKGLVKDLKTQLKGRNCIATEELRVSTLVRKTDEVLF